MSGLSIMGSYKTQYSLIVSVMVLLFSCLLITPLQLFGQQFNSNQIHGFNKRSRYQFILYLEFYNYLRKHIGYMDDEYGSLTAGLVASSLIGSIYFSPLILLSGRIRKTELDKKLVVSVMASVILAVFAVFTSMSYANEVALMITTSILVLTTIAVSSIFTARGIVYIGKLIQRTKSKFLAIY